MMQQPSPNGVPQQMAAPPPTYDQQQQNQYLQYQQQLQQQQWMLANQQQQQQQQPPPQQQQPYQYQPQPQAQPQQMYYQQQQPPQAAAAAAQPQYSAAAAAQPGGADGVCTLWIGDLQVWMDEQYLMNCFAYTGEMTNAKVIRNKQSGQSEGYGFIDFVSHAAAERALQAYNGTGMPNAEQNYRLNWASPGAGEKRSDGTPDFTIFVGDLAPDVTDQVLQQTFSPHYPSVKGAKIVTDMMTGRAKGYGFVRFGDEGEQVRAMHEMNGKYCSTRPMRIGPANKKNTASYPNTRGTQSEDDPNNTTIFVGGLNDSVKDDQLRQVFSQFGLLMHVKIPDGKRCGFVQFAERNCAEEALRMLNGTQLGGHNIRLSWGRSPPNKQTQQDPNQVNGGYYGYAQGQGAYGYAAAAQDPNLYYGGYPGYGNYQQPQQQ